MEYASAPADLQPWLQPRAFPPIPEPDDDDWPRGRGQTFSRYQQSNPQRVPRAASRKLKLAQGRHKIYLQPLGAKKDEPSFPDLGVLAFSGVAAFFGLEVTVLPRVTLASLEASGKPIRRRGNQYHAGDINGNLVARLPSDGLTLCAVTMADVWKGDFNFLFGLAFLQAHVGTFSFYRHQPNSPDCEYFHWGLERKPGDGAVLLRRGFQTLTHELGHTFGMKHCVYFSCLMQGANSLEEAEGRMPDLCPVCLRKLLWAARQESGDAVRCRYERSRAVARLLRSSSDGLRVRLREAPSLGAGPPRRLSRHHATFACDVLRGGDGRGKHGGWRGGGRRRVRGAGSARPLKAERDAAGGCGRRRRWPRSIASTSSRARSSCARGR
jgi:archaemetzincin